MLCDAPTRLYTAAVVGARGYVGRELIRLLDAHPSLAVTAAVSRELAGRQVASEYDAGPADLQFTASLDEHLSDCPDVVILGLPNGHAADSMRTMERADTKPLLVLDLSSDHRFDNSWTYAIPELWPQRLAGATRIANAGCFATAMHLTLAPVAKHLHATPHFFGISGYSGAGTSPSEKNDVGSLSAGVLPYALVGHTHEREVSHHSGCDVRFAPSVAGYPRGITMTALLELNESTTPTDLSLLYKKQYADTPLVTVCGQEMPRVQDVVDTPNAVIGGLTVDESNPTHAAVVCVLDNLLKGAASQAVQNINLALGLDATAGLLP